MAFTAITDRDIGIQEGTFLFSYTASGTILRGQAVEVVDDMYVIATDSNPAEGFVGVAAYGASKGDPSAVYGPGNIVWGRVSGTSVTAGTQLEATVDGLFQPATPPSSASVAPVGVALDTQGTSLGLARILLY